MKKLMLILVLVVTGLCFADWDAVQVPQPAKDIIDALTPLPTNMAKEYGSTEKVRLIHHLVVLRSELVTAIRSQAMRITALEKQVAVMAKELERQKVKIPEPGVEDELPPEVQNNGD